MNLPRFEKAYDLVMTPNQKELDEVAHALKNNPIGKSRANLPTAPLKRFQSEAVREAPPFEHGLELSHGTLNSLLSLMLKASEGAPEPRRPKIPH